PDRLKQDLIIALLLIERARGNDDLRAGMVERDEQPPVPPPDPRGVIAQGKLVRLDQPERLQRDRAERGDDMRVDEFDLAAQEIGAVTNLFALRTVIRA